jgi:soluble lytic murein transglycosylase-like protein
VNVRVRRRVQAQERFGDFLRAIACALGVVPGLLMLGMPDAKAQARIADVSPMLRLAIQREAARNFGLEGDEVVARLAAQVQQESAWNPKAASAYAQGLTQFTPATARWLPTICPAVGTPDPWDPQWSLRAQSCYMAWLLGRMKPYRYAGEMTTCARWIFALRGYNGGEAMLNRERLAAQRAGADANNWRAVEPYRARAAWAHKENIGYPRRILLVLEPAYLAAGWPGQAVC